MAPLAILAAAVGYAVSAIVLRILGRTDSADSLVLWPSVVMAAGATAVAAPGWVDFRPEHARILAAIAVFLQGLEHRLRRGAGQLAHELDEVLEPLLADLSVRLHPSTVIVPEGRSFDQSPRGVA